MNARRAPTGRDRAAARALARHWTHLRAAYVAIAPSPTLLTRVARAVRAQPRAPTAAPRRGRRLAAFVAGVTIAFLGGLAAGFVGAAGNARPRVERAGVAATAAAPAIGAADPARDASAATDRLVRLLGSASRLPEVDAAARARWVEATFDPDPLVRETARWLLRLVDGARPAERR